MRRVRVAVRDGSDLELAVGTMILGNPASVTLTNRDHSPCRLAGTSRFAMRVAGRRFPRLYLNAAHYVGRG
jgi:hypothetical protein